MRLHSVGINVGSFSGAPLSVGRVLLLTYHYVELSTLCSLVNSKHHPPPSKSATRGRGILTINHQWSNQDGPKPSSFKA